jgi:cell division protein FtsQ
MAKNKSNKKPQKQQKQKNEPRRIAPLKLPTKKILHFAVVFALVPLSYALLKNSPYSRVAYVKVIDRHRATDLKRDELLRLYKGRNIFDVDINSLASRIKNEHPIIEDALVKRVLPDTLEIDIIPRVPVAVIKSREYFPVDRTGMILPPQRDSHRLPVITGLSFWLGPRAGEKLETEKFKNAFLLIEALKDTRFPRGYKRATINAANHRNLSFYFENGIEVKIGGEDFPERLKKLSSTLARRDLDKGMIKYIDLRFKDVVIGPK